MSTRRAILVINASRKEAVAAATTLVALLTQEKFELTTASRFGQRIGPPAEKA